MTLERELNFFKQLEGGVRTVRALRDQRKSSDNQCEQVELNTLRCQRRADVSGDVIARGKPKLAKLARGQIAE